MCKMFFSGDTCSKLTSTKLGTEHPWVKGFQILSNAGPCPFPGGLDKKDIENTFITC